VQKFDILLMDTPKYIYLWLIPIQEVESRQIQYTNPEFQISYIKDRFKLKISQIKKTELLFL